MVLRIGFCWGMTSVIEIVPPRQLDHSRGDGQRRPATQTAPPSAQLSSSKSVPSRRSGHIIQSG
jgi:hypothetical protein